MSLAWGSFAAFDEKSNRRDEYTIRQAQELERFVTALGYLFTSTQIFDPEAVRTTLNVVLSKRTGSANAYIGYSVTNLPVQVASAKYGTRRIEDGIWLGDLFVAFKTDGPCLTLEKLKNLTNLDFQRKPIVWHSDDRKSSGVIDRYLVTKQDKRAKQVILAARLNASRCVTTIEIVNR